MKHKSRDASEPIVLRLLAEKAQQTPNAVAILAPARRPLTYTGLLGHVSHVVRALNSMGVGRNDRIAMILPNGPEMAVAFLAVASGASAAPLNPAYREHELDFYLSDLSPKALMIQRGMDTPARAIAEARGISIIDLTPMPGAEAGIFELNDHSRPVGPVFAGPDDVALLLHTSGTTSRPKLVPLTQTNVCVSARNHIATLALGPEDRCLNVMPLFHIHGLVSLLLSTVDAGGSVVCTPGFDPSRFFDWMAEFRPTWYSAAPMIHQSILAEAQHHAEVIARCPLRFVRSAAGPLPRRLFEELEDVFNSCVIESYGMTEAAAQITSNPLPPRERKVGSVGPAAGPEVAIMDQTGNVLSPGQTGEIVIRGPSVFSGYENNPTANSSASTEGWFRTGDLGHLDLDGYLFITGRSKEMINRGGEKISPREVDEVIMAHPAVSESATFGIPSPLWGEEVATVVVLRAGISATEKDLRNFALSRLADFKVPRHVFIVNEIPKSPVGKLQRGNLAERLGLTAVDRRRPKRKAPSVEPSNAIERTLTGIWSEVLGVNRVGIQEDFFELGGNSIKATQIASRVRAIFRVELPLTAAIEAHTVADMAVVITENIAKKAEDKELAHMLTELESLSDEEAQRRLAEEGK
jgi:acyl-CoA synthetase (AMP-forming)/AMP-acid ligase II